MTFFSAYLVAATVVTSLFVTLWVCSLVAKDVSIVDRFWGAGFVLLAWAVSFMAPEHNVDQIVLTSLVSIWGIRLSLYIHLRNRGHGEDYRYVQMRKHHGSKFWWYSFLSVFFIQGLLMLLVAAPIVFVLSRTQMESAPQAITTFGALGSVVWLIGFVFEAGGDYQLKKFKAVSGNKGKLLTTGLWSLTRHPNYFGDCCQWWGFGIFAFSHLPFGPLTFLGPVIMTFFIRKVSGVDLLEKSLKSTKPGYAEYVQNVPAFFPKISFWR
jgi:steroid 5-alpha reductase family enzyme